MITHPRLVWYARRLGRMSGPEVVHRISEQFRRVTDGRRGFGWDRFAEFDGPLDGIPGLVPGSSTIAAAGQDVPGIAIGNFHLLGQEWLPSAGGRPWYAQDGAWHRDPVSGGLWPGTGTFAFQVQYRHHPRRGDVKFVWELNRLQILQILMAAGAPEPVPDMLESWMRANPPFDGINWASGLEAASRVLSLLVVLSLADPSLRGRLDLPARRFLAAHAFWIARYPSLHSSANNHRVAELAALVLTSICAPGLAGAEFYLSRGLEGLEEAALSVFHADGVGAEQSPTYAAYSLEWYALAGLATDSIGKPFSAAVTSRLHAAAAHLRMMMDDGGCVPRIGDDDEGRALASQLHPEKRYVASVVALLARWLGDPALKPPSTDRHLRDRLAVAQQSEDAKRGGIPTYALDINRETTAPIVEAFPEGGYTIARIPTRQGTLLTVFDHGPLGFGSIAAHGHADALAVWLHWGDEPILVDAGTYLYHAGGKERDCFRGTSVHNTLAIEDTDQSIIVGPFNWRGHAHTRVVERTTATVSGEHDGYLHRFGLVHRRSISFKRNALVIEDRLIGRPSRTPLHWSIGFLLGPHILTGLAGARARGHTS
jgi:hypothetical protein